MDGGEKTLKKEKKILGGVLACLCVLAVGLVIGIVALAVSSNNEEVVVVNEESEAEILKQKYDAYVESYDVIRTEAQRLLAKDPPDVEGAIALYQQMFDDYMAEGGLDRASSFLLAENEDLLAVGANAQALEELLKVDYSVFNEPEQYRYYNMIIEQAKELGRTDVVAEYEPLRASVREAWIRNGEAADATAAKSDAEMKKAQEEAAKE